MKAPKQHPENKEGAALMVALWILIILMLIVGSFFYEVELESRLVSYKRKRFLAEMQALSGLEYAKAILDQREKAKQMEVEDLDEDEGEFMLGALHLKKGMGITRESPIEFKEGHTFTIQIDPVEGGMNANVLNREDWLDIFEMANVPSTDWDMMIDCLEDWIDENDLHGLNGAESDDEFYQEAGYPVKNGPLDSVEELLLVKGWGPEILYGREADEDGDEIFGIAQFLTVWGDGRLNLNTASVDALFAAGLSDEQIEEILELRLGDDGLEGTEDDGIPSTHPLANDSRFTLQTGLVKVTSTGDIFGTKYQIEAIFLLKSKDSVIVYWNEGPVKNDANTR
jgi:general secretion pathway protein K